MTTLVIGAAGQLGHCIKKVASERGFNNIIFPDKKSANILHVEKLREVFQSLQPEFVINCAAYTAVDKAEDDLNLCRTVNSDGAAHVALLCKEFNSTLVHVSTDFVFKGDKPELLTEIDVAEPINAYGITKLEGEHQIQSILDRHYIIRTSWLYSEFANNFVKTMLKLANGREQLSVIADQIGTPTYAIDLAGAILDIVQSEKTSYGVYHYSNEGVASWYDFAVAVFELSNIDINVLPIGTKDYPTRAIRPKFSVMDKSKIKTTFGLHIPHWRASLARCLEKL